MMGTKANYSLVIIGAMILGQFRGFVKTDFSAFSQFEATLAPEVEEQLTDQELEVEAYNGKFRNSTRPASRQRKELATEAEERLEKEEPELEEEADAIKSNNTGSSAAPSINVSETKEARTASPQLTSPENEQPSDLIKEENSSPESKDVVATPRASISSSEGQRQPKLTLFKNMTDIMAATSSSHPLFAYKQRATSLTENNKAHLVFLFVNKGVLPLFGVWLEHYKRSQLDSSPDRRKILLIFALNSSGDDTLKVLESTFSNHLAELLPPSTHTDVLLAPTPQMKKPTKRQRGQIWTFRVQTIARLLHTFPGIDIVVSDLDALWFKDPFTELFDPNPHADLVAGRDGMKDCPVLNAWEPDGSTGKKDNKRTICFGFVKFRNTHAIRRFVDQMKTSIANYHGDDQEAINCVLADQYHRTQHLPAPLAPNVSSIGSSYDKAAGFDIQRWIPRVNESEYTPPTPPMKREVQISILPLEEVDKTPTKQDMITLAIFPHEVINRWKCRNKPDHRNLLKTKTVVAHCFATDKEWLWTKFADIMVPFNRTSLYFQKGREEKKEQ